VENEINKISFKHAALTSDDPFHQEVGYWLWDADNKQVLKSFIVARGISVIAVGTASNSCEKIVLSVTLSSST
jgi:hypothetical protein